MAIIINENQIIPRLNRAIRRIRGRNIQGMLAAGAFIKLEAQRRTPVDTGNLKSSAYVDRGGTEQQPIVQVGFTANYAPAVHEDYPRGIREDGVGRKFLQRAITDNESRIVQIITDRARI